MAQIILIISRNKQEDRCHLQASWSQEMLLQSPQFSDGALATTAPVMTIILYDENWVPLLGVGVTEPLLLTIHGTRIKLCESPSSLQNLWQECASPNRLGTRMHMVAPKMRVPCW